MKEFLTEIELICRNALSDPESDGYADMAFEDILALVNMIRGRNEEIAT